jgi:hypothetical protein
MRKRSVSKKHKTLFPSYDTFLKIPGKRYGDRKVVTECNICGVLLPKWNEWTHSRWHLGNGDIGEAESDGKSRIAEMLDED